MCAAIGTYFCNMANISCSMLLSFILVMLCVNLKADTHTIDLLEGPKHVIPANKTSTFQYDVNPDTVFVVIQLLTQRCNLSLSTSPAFFNNATKTGTSVGMTTYVTEGMKRLTWYIRVMGTENVTAIVFVQLYTKDDPVPGGCNQVFSLENDPSVVLINSLHWTTVWFQWANLAASLGQKPLNCESKNVTNNLRYDIYVSYLPQRDFSEPEFLDAAEQLVDAEGIKARGTQISSLKDGPTAKSQIKVSSQASQGALYSVVVTRLDTHKQAAYVTAGTYACDFESDCSASSSALEIIFAIVLAVCGLFLLCVGHRYFKTTQVIFGLTFTSLLIYLLLSLSPANDAVKLGLSLTLGVIGGGLWWSFWYFCGIPVISVFLAGLCAGYLVASTLFFTPFGNIDWWSTELNYGMTFACVTLLFAVLLMAYTKVLSIVSCGLVGAYMLVLGLAIPLRSSVKYIFFNSLYHQTEEKYTAVQTVYPFLTQDIILATFWPILSVLGIIFQFYREHGRQPFEIPVRRGRNKIPDNTDEEEKLNASSETETSDERRPLLPGRASQGRRGQQAYQSNSTAKSRGSDRNRERNFLT